ncbi:Ribosomal RNA-processing protein 42 [Caenorhabditis elegans]|uniref:Ribosomal RNA-processing protein 42 n=1 Tax=Caenorhabditis elegans TaxID=6239 RepID=G5EDS8_CAEEL|nr:Exoribonuclease phosphorolytic domain-containing protein [Caenorhabditis elegans]CAB07377.2 Exoribonuclease phosphorolytic domain-containing protein [Caenorhabditis elegans]|eukprot:NP_508024.2 EXOSome (multiexonuclease complex) component [Caenorhabditis elegans]
MEVHLSDDEKLFLITGAEANIRNDGRSCQDFRQIILERGVLSGTNGSCRVQLGQTTDVLAGIKLELESYDAETEKEPKQPINFNVDFSANASSQFAGKGGDEYAEELSAAFQAAYSKALDIMPNLAKTQLADGYRWKINVDISVLQWDGSVSDAISIAIIGALSDLEFPEGDVAPDDGGKVRIVLKRPKVAGNVRDENVQVAMWKLDVMRCPLLLTISKIGTANLVDCTPEEECCIRSQLLVGLAAIADSSENNEPNYDVTCVKQVGGGLLEMESIQEMLELAAKSVGGLYGALAKRLKNEEMRKPGHSFLL